MKYDRKQKEIAKLKSKFVKYYRTAPYINEASAFIGRTPQHVNLWLKEDPEFKEAIDKAKSEFLQDLLPKVKPKEWILERTFRESFAPPTQTIAGDITVVFDDSLKSKEVE